MSHSVAPCDESKGSVLGKLESLPVGFSDVGGKCRAIVDEGASNGFVSQGQSPFLTALLYRLGLSVCSFAVGHGRHGRKIRVCRVGGGTKQNMVSYVSPICFGVLFSGRKIWLYMIWGGSCLGQCEL